MAEIRRRGHHGREAMLPPHTGEPLDDNLGHHMAHREEGYVAWPFNLWGRMLDGGVEVLIPVAEVAEAVQRHTNYADNASGSPNADNVLVCRHDDRMFVDLLNDALSDLFLRMGKICKGRPVLLGGEDVSLTINNRWNYDESSFQVLAEAAQRYLVAHVVCDWLALRNSDTSQPALRSLELAEERLDQLVGWRARMERRNIDPLL